MNNYFSLLKSHLNSTKIIIFTAYRKKLITLRGNLSVEEVG